MIKVKKFDSIFSSTYLVGIIVIMIMIMIWSTDHYVNTLKDIKCIFYEYL
jgi:hypothetical protein